jgi:hypothetical protein
MARGARVGGNALSSARIEGCTGWPDHQTQFVAIEESVSMSGQTGNVMCCTLSDTLTPHIRRKPHVMAYHQAGHAIVAYLLGYPFYSVSVEGTSGIIHLKHGVSRNRSSNRKALSASINHVICVTVAGPLAETLYTHHWQDSGDDEYNARDFTEVIYPLHHHGRRDLFLNKSRFTTMQLLTRPKYGGRLKYWQTC